MQVVIVIPAEHQTAINALVQQQFDPVGGNQTFTVPLYEVGDQQQTTPSHYWCNTEMSELVFLQLTQLKRMFPGCTIEAYPSEARTFPDQLLTELQLVRKTPIMP